MAARLVTGPHDANRCAPDPGPPGANVPERVAMRLTGHKSRTIFDGDNIIHEQELLDAFDFNT